MFELFTQRARKTVGLALQESQRLKSPVIAPEHLLLGIVQERGGVAATILKKLDVDVKIIRLETEKLIQPSRSPMPLGNQIPWTPEAKRVLEFSLEESKSLGHGVVGTEHLLLGLLRQSESIAAQVLGALGVKLQQVRDTAVSVLRDS